MNERKRKNWTDRAARLRLAGLCIGCMGNRTAEPGHTADRCATCAEKNRVRSRERMRKKRGAPLDAPLVPRGWARGPRANLMSKINRSDEYAPEKYKPLRPSRCKPRRYGSLTREDIRVATSALPLRPPASSHGVDCVAVAVGSGGAASISAS